MRGLSRYGDLRCIREVNSVSKSLETNLESLIFSIIALTTATKITDTENGD